MMMNVKKLMIILALTLFLIQVSYASDINESVSAEINDIVIDEIIEVDEVTNEMALSEENVEQTINNLMVENSMPPEEYPDSGIINSDEKYLEVEISEDQYYTYMDEILEKSLNNYTEFDETDDEINASFNNISYRALTSYQLLVCNKLDVNFQSNLIIDNGIEFSGFEEYDKMTLDVLAYTNKNCIVLAQVVNKYSIFCGDKLNSKFVYSIDNSIVGSANNFYYYYTNFCFIIYPQSSQYFFTGFYLTECVYDFFSVFNNRMNEVCSFRI